MGKLTLSLRLGVMLLCSLSVNICPRTAPANENEPAKYWAVTGVAANDTLNIRDVPDGDSKKIGSIPPNAHGIKHIGCMTPTPSMDRWMTMTPAEKANSKLEWCRIEYKGKQGWVAARYLKPDIGPNADAGASSAPSFAGH